MSAVEADGITPVFTATRAEALRRLDAFLPRAGRAYADGRNADAGPDAERSVSALSPYLRYRLLVEREVIAAALDLHGPHGADKFVSEVLWRTYFKGWLELRPAAWSRFLAERDAGRDAMARSGGLARAVAAAEEGRTGIEGFDDWARELVAYGYLHNHARMWFASIWIFTLRLPWALGADFFLRHLVDADPASNTLSWRWVAGLQTPGKTYLATADNIARYTSGRFSPRGLAAEAPSLTEEPLPGPRALPGPEPVPAGRALLLMHPEDFGPESFAPEGTVVAGALAATGGSAHWPWGPAARRFVDAAAEDAAERARARFGCDAAVLDGMDAEGVVAAARAAGARMVLAPHAPVGPVADALAALAGPLRDAGLPLVRQRRPWDEKLWPLATKGFFPFRQHSPAVLAEEGVRL
ncbi:DNA photolyase FAD-binding protein [Lichenibacterium minor]|uniref:DNA photolyase FAD-binding protein n=1 Tax=Lichenibacterium minor TaxID=2316528 RepID=A0A4V1RTX3_9HYPH|nr:FAD-binding domain-containing protein [Lichenibacterium minor]RYC29154.1 DNA photolyase FAD-binding protein [Lichenibacterium minor]